MEELGQVRGPLCFECSSPVDVRTAAARIVGAGVVKVCRECAGGGEQSVAPRSSRVRCRCGDDTDVGRASAVVGAAGVELMCPACARDPSRAERLNAARRAPAPVEEFGPEEPEARRSARPFLFIGGAAVCAIAVALVLWPSAGAEATRATAKLAGASGADVEEARATEILSVEASDMKWLYIPPPPPVPESTPESAAAAVEIPGGEAWVHPIPNTSRPAPKRMSRRFGAERPGNRPAECGAGHCGVDLMGPRGSPVVAIADGVVERVETASGGSSGKYVRLLHPGGVESYYMHLDDVVPGIARGAPVEAGEMIGSLGRTGIENSAPHLHFAVTVPRDGGWWLSSRYVNPEAALAQSKVIDLFELQVNDRKPRLESRRKRAKQDRQAPEGREEPASGEEPEARAEAETEAEEPAETEAEAEAKSPAEASAEASGETEAGAAAPSTTSPSPSPSTSATTSTSTST